MIIKLHQNQRAFNRKFIDYMGSFQIKKKPDPVHEFFV